MFHFRTLPLRYKLALGFAVGVVVSLALAVASMLAVRTLAGDLHTVVDDRVAKYELLTHAQNNAGISAIALRNLVLDESGVRRAQEMARLDEVRKHNSEIYEKLEHLVKLPKGRALFAEILEKRKLYASASDSIKAAIAAGDLARAKLVLLDDMPKLHEDYFQAIDALIAFQQELMEGDAVRATATSDNIALLLGSGVAAAVLLSLLAGWLATRSITRELGGEPADVAKIARAVAEGNLGSRIVVDDADHHSVMASMRDMQSSLRSIISQVRASADHIATGAAQIATGTQDLSARTEQQASSLQQTAASLEQLTGTVSQNSESAREADRLAAGASGVAGTGGRVVGEVVGTMDDITTSSRKIADIISVIDGIAFQTNILALNAAVEAARAGEQGRGFAVVAGEVRNLAQRSAQAAKEIKTLIGASVERIDNGSRQVSQAGETMNEIVSQVSRVSQLIAEISNATQEQSSGIEQVNAAMVLLDQATQQNAALVEESAAASESLRQQAAHLLDSVASFKLEAAH